MGSSDSDRDDYKLPLGRAVAALEGILRRAFASADLTPLETDLFRLLYLESLTREEAQAELDAALGRRIPRGRMRTAYRSALAKIRATDLVRNNPEVSAFLVYDDTVE